MESSDLELSQLSSLIDYTHLLTTEDIWTGQTMRNINVRQILISNA